MKFQFIVDNKTETTKCMGEWGLSILIETGDKKILLDTGMTDLYAENAANLGINLKEVDGLVISHGHFDHTGGVPFFVECNEKAPIYLHRDALFEAYGEDDGAIDAEPCSIRWSDEEMDNIWPRIQFTSGVTEIFGNVTLIGDIPDLEGYPPTEQFWRRIELEDGGFETDFTSARIGIETTVQYMDVAEMEHTYTLRHTLVDAEGKAVKSCEVKGMPLDGKQSHTTSAWMTVSDPHLWDCDDPYLYTLVTEVYTNGILEDVCKTVTGIRHIEFDPDKGFLLNGNQVKLKGVNMHQDHAGVGSGIPDGLQEWRLLQLKKFGCNAYRSSHNPMTPELLDACDRLGILVIEENRLTGINKEHIDLLERMIRRDRNHPSIILWSVGNEEWGLEWNDFGTRIAESMREYCHRFDPSRKMTVASSSGPHILIPADVAGYNYILQNPVEEHRASYPERCALGSEETTGSGTRGVYFDEPEGRPRTAVDAGGGRMIAINRGKQGPDSLYNCIERGWKFYDERPWLGGVFYWTGFDYRGEPNPMIFPATGSEFGILDYCGFPKDEAFYLKSWWTSEPVLHILPHWNLDGHEGEKISVWVYSNCEEVELIVNGRRLERKKMPKNGHLEWDAVYKPGYVKAIGYKAGRKVMETRLDTAGEPVDAVWTYESIGDITIANVEMRDAKGRFVPTACVEMEFTAPEGSRILGWGNGDPAFQHVERPANGENFIKIITFNGLAQVILQKNDNFVLN